MNPKWIQYLNINVISNYLVCNFYHNNNLYFDIWNIENGEHMVRKIIDISVRNGDTNPYYKVKDGTKISIPFFDGCDYGDKVVICVPAYSLSFYLKNVKEEDNYVLFIAKMKK